ncbi:translation elongation factor Ts [Butyricicoccus pullicaecorum]|uniref:Elongation factor Ts n=1 Tax=Butyricicoccus pullicaecorum 1.2 TaxID=1203606 RepID=R8W136_9FIRM|nr:translation elongation factor Ts [Butyricicoccus pullicaecorum]EOQ38404.1 translation elongation factor Ts [Butyricicoccus pullicaecorum 1.2]SKA53954.1 elongation factor Ts [Butyricicoccus pullicaecorum DSM 23266]
MAFTAADVKKLREMTSVGMMECKKALTEADGDFDKAIELLREKGLAKAAKKADRVAAEGVVCAKVCDECGIAAIVEVNAETDFVAKNADFQAFVNDVATVIIKENPADVDALKACKMGELTVETALQEKVLTIGENIQIRRFARFDANTVNVAYNHMGGVIGTLVALEVSDNLKDNATVKELGKDIGMQAAAMNPAFMDKSEVDEATLAKEKEILLAQALEENKTAAKPKPEQIIHKMVEGRIGKYYEENCLLQQAFVKENKVTVEQHIAAVAKELGGEIKLVKCVRFERGEGIEKKQDDFAAEVASMAK